jgi:hypothetical protein
MRSVMASCSVVGLEADANKSQRQDALASAGRYRTGARGGRIMLTTLTFVKMQSGLTRDQFFDRWCRHTRDFDLKNHPEIQDRRLMLIDGDGPHVGIAETHWEDAAALERGLRWYDTPAGRAHRQDLETFVDIAHSPIFVVTHEARISRSSGVHVLAPGGTPPNP